MEKTPQCFFAQGPRGGWSFRLVLPACPRTQAGLDNRGTPLGPLQGAGKAGGGAGRRKKAKQLMLSVGLC